MSNESANEFLQLLEKDEAMKSRVDEIISKIEQGECSNEGIEKELSEQLLMLAGEKGYEFTLDELQNLTINGLSDDEMNSVVGGMTSNGFWMTTIAYSCIGWEPSGKTWLGVENTCGSCKHWLPNYEKSHYEGWLIPTLYIGRPEYCTKKTHYS